MIIDSDTIGDPTRFRSLNELEIGLRSLATPRDRGPVMLVVSRGAGGRRSTPERVRLTPDGGVPGDSWGQRRDRSPDGQIAVMQANVAKLIANQQSLTLFGDNLFLDLDLSAENLPLGTRVQVGSALLEVTRKPHDGCRKFRARFGDAALRFVAKRELRHRNLRGIYMRVVEEGEVAVGDGVEVIARPRA
jgi:MOSC domain-containing protein YiiM